MLPCARCRCFSSLYTSREGTENRKTSLRTQKEFELDIPAHTPVIEHCQVRLPKLSQEAHTRKPIPDLLSLVIIILLPKWKFALGGNVLSLTHIVVIVRLSLPLTAPKPYVQVTNIAE